ncbi:class I SAM-dependent methyltransferase [Treponema endosymbiont of Eucomonympha sp.]|uniref:class I SAM-dependent methyltransferase n=1 Tax=Treponema endosymbiont of Eucomonympha sp. TaxID=1580831 RepID=UPI000751205C|nr:class I SAM-dependent methyltransferase [Treponema endosymbiont of Eucomonympha sp.]
MEKFLRKKKDLAITGGFAKWYDKNSREHRRGELAAYAREIAGSIQDGAAVLEVAPGPGYVSIELAKLGDFHITGIELSADFVEICKANARRENAAVDFVQGNVSAMPFAPERFDYLFCSAAFKNFHDPAQALREMHRVLKPGGKGLIIDMNKDTTTAARKAEVDAMNLSGFERLFMAFSFATFLRDGAYRKGDFAEMLAASPFRDWRIAEHGVSLSVYLQK